MAIHVNSAQRVYESVPIFIDVNTKCECAVYECAVYKYAIYEYAVYKYAVFEYAVNEDIDKMFRRRTVLLLRLAQNKIIEINFIKLTFSFVRYCVKTNFFLMHQDRFTFVRRVQIRARIN